MLTAAEEGAFSASSDPCVFFPLAASEGVSKNSRLGFASKNVAPHQGSAWSNYGKALGIQEVVWENCGGSDDSARYYDPQIGRFISEDPLGFDGDGTNFYDYAVNDPNVFIDPFGLWHCAAGADCNFTPEFKKGLDRFQQCIGKTEVIITGGRRPPTPSRPNTGHTRGEACDIGRNSNPNLPRDKVVSCFLESFPNSYGQEEKNGGGIPGTHFHFQYTPLPSTPPGFAPGIRPYQP